ncbi:ribonucleoside-diphosphate reductase subunit alpha [uncultured Kiloniella sp.]|uniref:ribonucleoside-diphosphate reductase subunit alpha n=1 Tax=uncultured Kiloniella sp. TaxID=1133091 RepID=UPI0026085822|nr:ribonucleoside-diphosphate reductase subunit alpha [uncultured Kiloniella sp.]
MSLIESNELPGEVISSANQDTPVTSGTDYKVIRRNGKVSPFEPEKITTAITKAFIAIEGSNAVASPRVHDTIHTLSEEITRSLTQRDTSGRTFHIEDIQDRVELALMRGGHQKVARAYVLYREERNKDRQTENNAPSESQLDFSVTQPDGSKVDLDQNRLETIMAEACDGLKNTSKEKILSETKRNIYDGISSSELALAPILAARTLIETEPEYSYVSARLLLDKLRTEVLSFIFERNQTATQSEIADIYPDYFRAYIKKGLTSELLDPELARYDLDRLSAAIKPERDTLFQYLGLQTLYDRYFLHQDENRIELPQAFFMRVAMGLALRETDREEKTIEFYDLLSSFDFMCSTPTLFNSGTQHPQLSSCFLTTISDDLGDIFKSIKDNALLAKYSGGLGNDWTSVRGLGAHIKGTNGESQGVVPFLKVANDTAIAVNQGGKRKGAVCAYLETWHLDIEEFLDLRKNTGDDRRRTHDMNTANWVPDLFMERVREDASWTLFSPDETPDLHNLYGRDFQQTYENYETKAENGELRAHKKIRAIDLWRRMLTMLFETGHPWITFKDPCNIRSPQNHIGVVHSSNLCTEITLNTSNDEVAVCNLGSINLAAHTTKNGIDHSKLEKTTKTAMRMLDNVIDINFYTIPEARKSNLKHRPVGLGLMGFQDALQKQRIPYGSDAAITFADESMEAISFHTITASSNLAEERGSYASFKGSLWSKGILPLDSMKLLEEQRTNFQYDTSSKLDWEKLRKRVKKIGMRNSNTMAIAPTATISNICGVSQSIEPSYQNLFVKSNMSGEFTVVNASLVNDLKALNLWDDVMISDLKYYDGSIGEIDRIPQDLKTLYATAFEIDSAFLIEAAARRQKWIDQAQSLNLYLANPSGKALDALYQLAWERGLKTTYYLRSKSATHVEKSTLKGTDGKLNAVATNMTTPISTGQVCSIDDPECEACQ